MDPITAKAIGDGLSSAGNMYSAKQQAKATTNAARISAEASTKAAQMQDDATKRALKSVQDQAFRDELLSNKASQGQYKADVAGLRNAYEFSGDDAVNNRSQYVSIGRTNSRVRGQRTNQMNYIRDLLGYGQPQESLDTFVEPDALQRSALIIPEDQEYLDPVAPRPV
jgi:hypothetical protein